jgi:hypothetical protein
MSIQDLTLEELRALLETINIEAEPEYHHDVTQELANREILL